jgi:hypothetical protein
MPAATERYVVPEDPPREVDCLKKAIGLAIQLHTRLNCSGEIVLLVPNKKTVDGTTLVGAIGLKAVSELKKNRTITVNYTHRLRLESESTIKKVYGAEVIVAIYAYPKMLDEVDRLLDVKAVVVVPWNMNDVTMWIQTWNPIIFGQQPTPPKKLIQNPVVEQALRTITNRINLSTGLGHPSDHEFAIDLLKCVHKRLGLESASSTRAWAIQNGWYPEDADQLARIVQSLLDGKRVHGGRKGFRCTKEVIERLEEQIKERERNA